MKNNKLLLGIIVAFTFLLSIGMTYAYFSVMVTGNEQAKNIEVTTGTLNILYNSGQEINVTDIYPGWSIKKTFTVENVGSLDAYYSINFEELTNEIQSNEMKMSITCEGVGCQPLNLSAAPTSTGPFVDNIGISPGVIHSYELTLTFIETNSEQNYNQNKRFGGKITIEQSIGLITLQGILRTSLGSPISGATVTLRSEPRTTITEENGSFVFEKVELGNHTLSAIDSSDRIILNNTPIKIASGSIQKVDGTSIVKNTIADEVSLNVTLNEEQNIKKIEFISQEDTFADYLISNYSELGLTRINQNATEMQNYSTIEYRYQGAKDCRNVEMTEEVCSYLGGNDFFEGLCFSDEEQYFLFDLDEEGCSYFDGTYVDNRPNNYIRFNDEMWRILGVFETKSNDEDLLPEYRVKIVRDDTIGNNYYNSLLSGNRWNDWSTSTLQYLLNSGAYYNRTTSSSVNDCSNQSGICDYSQIGLSVESKNLISDALWYLGNVDSEVQAEETIDSYIRERLLTNNINNTSPATWTGKVGLMYLSDYMYASDVCYQGYVVGDDIGYSAVNSICLGSNWLMKKDTMLWMISPVSSPDGPTSSDYAVIVDDTMTYDNGIVNRDRYISTLPTVYLKEDVVLSSGNGSLENPYIVQ